MMHVDLKLVTRFAIEHGDRRRRPPKLQLDDREAIQRRIPDVHALPRQEFANLGETQSVGQPQPLNSPSVM